MNKGSKLFNQINGVCQTVGNPRTVIDFDFPGILEKSVLSKAVVNILEKAHDEERLSELNFEDFLYNLGSYPVPDGCRTLSHNILESQADFLLSQVKKERSSIFLEI